MTPSRPPVALVAAALALVLVAAAPGSSGQGRIPPPVSVADVRAVAEPLVGKAEAIRADLEAGSFDRAVARLAIMAGLSAHPDRTTGGRVQLDPPLARPIADILGAATHAAEGVERAVTADDGRSPRLSRRANELGNRIAGALSRGERWPVERARELRGRVLQSPILQASADGGRTIAAALDRSLPLLLGSAPRPRSSSSVAVACDMLDQRPVLCVNGTGANAIDAEAILVVDLGGDDTYTSSAGSASSARCVDDPDDQSCYASVLIDLGGDDTYRMERAVSHNHLVGAGSAMTGIGMLVDVAGNDRYLADLSKLTAPLDLSFGFGSAQMGLGLLADLTGDDLYELTADPDDMRLNQYYFAASLTGMGGIIDSDGANEYRALVRGFQEPFVSDGGTTPPSNIMDTMGAGIFGGAVLYDRTGNATFDVRLEVSAGPRQDVQGTGAVAFGTGLIGDAAVIAGPGATTYSAIARRTTTASLPSQSEEPPLDGEGRPVPVARLPGSVSISAHAVGALGTGIIDDRGGDDTYLAHARTEHHLDVVAEPGCGCDRAIATLETDSWDGYAAFAGVSSQALGSSVFAPDAGALINDHGGDDAYIAKAEHVASAGATNRLGDPSGGARADAIPSRFPQVNVFGQGMGSDAAPSTVLDHDGDDVYELVARSTAHANAEAGTGQESAVSATGLTQTVGQGASFFDPAHGTLMDLGGRDEYRAHSISRATTNPAPGAWEASRTIIAQGAIGGVLADVDEGIADSFEATPELGAGVGVRGEGPGWIDASQTFPGFGIVPLQPARRDVTLTMAEDNASSVQGGWVEVRARLVDGGLPLAGQEVTFDIERSTTGPLGEAWSPHRFRAHGMTDEDGWAVGYLDADEFRDYYFGDLSGMTLRIAARYHGDIERRTAVAAQPFAIT